MIDIKSISQNQRKYKNRTPNDLNIKLIAIMVNFLFQYRWWAFPFANTFSRNFTSDWKLSKWCSCFPLRTYLFSVDLKTYLTAHNLKNLPYTFQVFLFEVGQLKVVYRGPSNKIDRSHLWETHIDFYWIQLRTREKKCNKQVSGIRRSFPVFRLAIFELTSHAVISFILWCFCATYSEILIQIWWGKCYEVTLLTWSWLNQYRNQQEEYCFIFKLRTLLTY